MVVKQSNNEPSRKSYIDPDKYTYLASFKEKKGETRDEWESRQTSYKAGIGADELTTSVYAMMNKIDKFNQHIGVGTWYVILSQYFKDLVEIEKAPYNSKLRFSLFVIQDSRSGKNTNVNVITRISDKIGLTKTSPSSFTEKAIIGLADMSAIEFNHKLRAKMKGDESGKYDESMLREEYKKGLMENYDLLIIEEAKNLFLGGHKDNLTLYIQEMLDPKDQINVSTGTAGDFVRPVECSLIMTTIPFENSDVESKIDDGLFQRISVFKRKVDKQEQKQRHKMYTQSYLSAENLGESHLDVFASEIAIELKKTKSILRAKVESMPDDDTRIKIIENGNRKLLMRVTPEAKEYVDKMIKQYMSHIEDNFFGDIVDKIDKFSDLFITMFFKIGAINSILHRDKDYLIKVGDVMFAEKHIIRRSFDGLISLANGIGRKNNENNIKFARVIGNDWRTTKSTLGIVASVGKMNRLNSIDKIKELINKGYVETKDTGAETMYRCSEKVFKILLQSEDLEKYNTATSKLTKLIDKDIRYKYLILWLRKQEEDNVNLKSIDFKFLSKVFFNDFNNGYSNYERKIRTNGMLSNTHKNNFKLMNETKTFNYETLEQRNQMENFIKKTSVLYKFLNDWYLKDKNNKHESQYLPEMQKWKNEFINEHNLEVPKEFGYEFDNKLF